MKRVSVDQERTPERWFKTGNTQLDQAEDRILSQWLDGNLSSREAISESRKAHIKFDQCGDFDQSRDKWTVADMMMSIAVFAYSATFGHVVDLADRANVTTASGKKQLFSRVSDMINLPRPDSAAELSDWLKQLFNEPVDRRQDRRLNEVFGQWSAGDIDAKRFRITCSDMCSIADHHIGQTAELDDSGLNELVAGLKTKIRSTVLDDFAEFCDTVGAAPSDLAKVTPWSTKVGMELRDQGRSRS